MICYNLKCQEEINEMMLAIAQLKGEYTTLHQPANIPACSSFDNSYWVLFLGEGDVNSGRQSTRATSPLNGLALTKNGTSQLHGGLQQARH